MDSTLYLKRHREILSADFLDLFYNLYRKTISVLKRSTIFIGSLIHIFQSKLIQQIAFMYRMDLHTVHTRIL